MLQPVAIEDFVQQCKTLSVQKQALAIKATIDMEIQHLRMDTGETDMKKLSKKFSYALRDAIFEATGFHFMWVHTTNLSVTRYLHNTARKCILKLWHLEVSNIVI